MRASSFSSKRFRFKAENTCGQKKFRPRPRIPRQVSQKEPFWSKKSFPCVGFGPRPSATLTPLHPLEPTAAVHGARRAAPLIMMEASDLASSGGAMPGAAAGGSGDGDGDAGRREFGRGAPRRRSTARSLHREELERIGRLWRLPARSTTARAVLAIQAATAKPICDGGLAHYFLREEQRRGHLEESPPLAPPSADLALAALPASHRRCGKLEECCPVCLQMEMDGDSNETIMLPCGHKFHRKCKSSLKSLRRPRTKRWGSFH